MHPIAILHLFTAIYIYSILACCLFGYLINKLFGLNEGVTRHFFIPLRNTALAIGYLIIVIGVVCLKTLCWFLDRAEDRESRACLGDYVLATKYADCDPHDPWRVGFVMRIIEDKFGKTYIIGEHDGTWTDFREYRHAKKITADEGREWLTTHHTLTT